MWPPSFDKRVDLTKVDTDVIKMWMERRLEELMDIEDEIFVNFATQLVEDAAQQAQENKTEETILCPKRTTVQLEGKSKESNCVLGFLEGKTLDVVKERWDMLLSAQDSPNGIPPALSAEKQQEAERKRLQIEAHKAKLEQISKLAE